MFAEDVARALLAKMEFRSSLLIVSRSVVSLMTVTCPDVRAKEVVLAASLSMEIPVKATAGSTGSSQVRERNPSSRSRENSTNCGGVRSAVCTDTPRASVVGIPSSGLLAISSTEEAVIEM